MKLIKPFPKIIPEMNYNSSQQLKINSKDIPTRIVSLLFYKRIEQDKEIYLKYHKTGKIEYMPLFTMNKALAAYQDYFNTKQKEYLELFLEITEKLIERITFEKNMAGWKYKKEYFLPGYPKIKNSYSALYNARGLSLLIRYKQFKPSKRINHIIKKILNGFEVASDNDGVMKKEEKDTWYLEYSYGNESPVVFNGFMSSLISLLELKKYGKENIQKQAKNVFEKGFETLIKNAEKMIYKTKWIQWFRYDTNKLYFTESAYPTIMIKQLEFLSKETKNKELGNFYNKAKTIIKKNSWKAKIYQWIYFLEKKMVMK